MSAKLLLFRKVFPGFLAVMAMGFMQADAQMITGNFTEGAGGTEWTLGDNVSGGGPGLPTISAGKLNITQDAHYDARHFGKKGDIVTAFAALNYAHGWLDAGARLGLFDVGHDSELFTVD